MSLAANTVNVGSAPGDGTGDPGRTAWQKYNSAMVELYGAGTGRLIKYSVITSGTAATFTPQASTKSMQVFCLGGGASGGATNNAGLSAFAAGIGGGSGAWCSKYYDTVSGTYTYTVGAGGVGATTAGAAGGVGGNTTFGALTAPGGDYRDSAGILAGTNLATNFTTGRIAGGGLGGAVATGGDINAAGTAGDAPIVKSTTTATSHTSGQGANSPYGTGGAAYTTAGTASAGANATGYGAGGSGGKDINTGVQPGGNGSGGLILVWEYS